MAAATGWAAAATAAAAGWAAVATAAVARRRRRVFANGGEYNIVESHCMYTLGRARKYSVRPTRIALDGSLGGNLLQRREVHLVSKIPHANTVRRRLP